MNRRRGRGALPPAWRRSQQQLARSRATCSTGSRRARDAGTVLWEVVVGIHDTRGHHALAPRAGHETPRHAARAARLNTAAVVPALRTAARSLGLLRPRAACSAGGSALRVPSRGSSPRVCVPAPRDRAECLVKNERCSRWHRACERRARASPSSWSRSPIGAAKSRTRTRTPTPLASAIPARALAWARVVQVGSREHAQLGIAKECGRARALTEGRVCAQRPTLGDINRAVAKAT